MNLDKRMKKYEHAFKFQLPSRMPIIIRVDGRSFHTLTKKCKEPFDDSFASHMDLVALQLLSDVQNSRLAYIQSDEISLLLVDYNRYESEQWFDGNIQKMTSISASLAGSVFSLNWSKLAMFDSRVFVLPEREVVNYFIWRQQDATRNSIQMVAQSLYSHKELHKKNTDELQEMIFQKGQNWNDLPAYWKRGRVARGDIVDNDIPIFSKDRKYIEDFMGIEEE